jgi:hypothetical protein
MKMKNGHVDPAPSSSIWQYIAERGDVPPSPETLALDADRQRVEAVIATGALDEFDLDTRIKLAWGIVRQRGEVQN